jgi:hypothetical protein
LVSIVEPVELERCSACNSLSFDRTKGCRCGNKLGFAVNTAKAILERYVR